jgi:hypothetical protein
MSPKTPDTTTGVSPPPKETQSAQRRPRRIPYWILPSEETQVLFQEGHGTAPNLIYARGVPESPSLYPTSFDMTQCTLVIVEVGFCMHLGCDIEIEKKTENYSPLIASIGRHLAGCINTISSKQYVLLRLTYVLISRVSIDSRTIVIE